jgi:hypothetical protein
MRHTEGIVKASRRYHVATAALQGILAGCSYGYRHGPGGGSEVVAGLSAADAADAAVRYADALLAALAEAPAPPPPAPDDMVDLGAECAAADPRTGEAPLVEVIRRDVQGFLNDVFGEDRR